MHHHTEKTAHTTAFVTPVVGHWLEREYVYHVFQLITDVGLNLLRIFLMFYYCKKLSILCTESKISLVKSIKVLTLNVHLTR